MHHCYRFTSRAYSKNKLQAIPSFFCFLLLYPQWFLGIIGDLLEVIFYSLFEKMATEENFCKANYVFIHLVLKLYSDMLFVFKQKSLGGRTL